MNKTKFNELEKKILSEELTKIQRDYLDYLEDNDNDEDARERLFVVSYLKNVIRTGVIDELDVDFNDDSICIVDTDE